jgi:predicted Zn-ribbon and HTH transcriptional regulator
VVYSFICGIRVEVIYQKVYELTRMGEVTLRGFKCERCGHIWAPREEEQPKVCPRCKSPYWNTPRRIQGKKGDLDFKEKRKLR